MRDTHAEKAELEPFGKGYQVNLRWLGNPAISKPFMSLSVSWVVMQGTTVAEGSTGEVARGRIWGLRWDGEGDVNPLVASDYDWSICATALPSLSKSLIQIFWNCVYDFGWPKVFFPITLRETLPQVQMGSSKKWVNRIGQCLGGLIIRPRAERLLRTVPDH